MCAAATNSVSRPRAGFTLIELLISLAILGVLATMLVPVVQMQMQRGREAQLREGLREIRVAIDEYKRASDAGRIAKRAGASGYPPNLEMLVEGVVDLKNPKAGKLRFLRRIPTDPVAPTARSADVGGWGLRSYASEANDPRSGDDVFDVYSRSSQKGLNGIPYSQW